ncbi:MAG TPA: hypothetical protein DEH78_04285 [Solibacterales bacterium]|nr:hypothetical protein [Bryobacterales bacterium]
MPGGAQHTRRQLLRLASAGALWAPLRAAPLLSFTCRDEQLSVEAPSLHFLGGRVGDRLQNGLSVGVEIQILLSTEPRGAAVRRGLERFLVSYDLWEERFAVAPVNRELRPVTHLSAPQAEAWCLDHVLVPVSGMEGNRPYWVRLDIRAEEAKEVARGSEQAFDIATLVDLFARRSPDRQMKWSAEAGPIRLAALPRPAEGRRR